MIYTRFLRRLAASLIDLIIIILIYSVIINIEFSIFNYIYKDFDLSNTKYFRSVFILMVLSAFLLMITYFSVFESSKLQGGFGKIIMKISVVDDFCNKLKFSKALIRALFKSISIGIYISYISILFTKRNRTFYDFILGTNVVNKKETSDT